MQKYVIYEKNLLYTALYLKRKAQMNGQVTLTVKEYIDFMNLVKQNIEIERSIAKNFTCEYRPTGEPDYPKNNKNEIKESEATFNYIAQNDVFVTNSSLNSLQIKSILSIPGTLRTSIIPDNYEKVLNIPVKRKNPEMGDE